MVTEFTDAEKYCEYMNKIKSIKGIRIETIDNSREWVAVHTGGRSYSFFTVREFNAFCDGLFQTNIKQKKYDGNLREI